VAGPAAAERPKRCAASPGRTVEHNRWVRIYERRAYNVPDGIVLVGCDRATRRRRVLAESYTEYGDAGAYGMARLRRRFAAVHRSSVEYDDDGLVRRRRSRIAVFDSRTWHERSVHARPRRLVLAVNGGVAWTERRDGAVAVRALDSHGARTLDSGAIAPRSLRIAMTIVRWRNAGERRFARLR
jgi:hypothetical protein